MGVFWAHGRSQQTWDSFWLIAGHSEPCEFLAHSRRQRTLFVFGSQLDTANLGLFWAHRTQQTWVYFGLVGCSKPGFVWGA